MSKEYAMEKSRISVASIKRGQPKKWTVL